MDDEYHKWRKYTHLGRLSTPIFELWAASLLWQKIDQTLIDAASFTFSDSYVRMCRQTCGARIPEVPKTSIQCGTKPMPSATAASKYQYQPLPSDGHIRLIHIIPATNDSAIRVWFSTVLLSDAPPFETLSYVWGSQKVTRTINIEEYSFEVGVNLHDALCMLRLRDTERCFWIDALSINQSDTRERSTQVSMMPKIYAASKRTTVWLGSGADLSPEAIQVLKSMTRDHWDANIVAVTSKEEVWRELGDLYANPWFYRVWIIQEVIMAQDIQVLMNGESWPWVLFIQAALNAVTRGIKFQTVFDPESAVRLERVREAFKNKGPAPTILHALALGRRSLATLDVDKVYGILGLSAEGFEVNYDESTTSTYIRLAKTIADRGGVMSLLNHVEDHSYRFKKRLPSWVPDWEVHDGAQPLINTAAAIKWNASKDNAGHTALSAHNRHLHVHGFVLDTLDRVGNLFTEDVPLSGAPRSSISPKARARSSYWAEIIAARVSRRVAQWRTLAMRHGTMFSAEDARYDAYVSTLTAGNTISGDTWPEVTKRGYELWCRIWKATSLMNFNTIVSAYDGFGPEETAQATGFMRLHIQAAWGRRLYTTQQHGIMGLCPSLARRGDLLVIIHGGQTPYIIRKRGNGQFRFIGECYAHAFMHGEAEEKDRKVEEFVLV